MQPALIITGTDPSNEIIYLLMSHLRSMSVYIRWLVGGGNYFYVGLELCPCQNGPLVLPQIGALVATRLVPP